MPLYRARLRDLICRYNLLFSDLLEYNGSISQLIHGDLVSSNQMKSVSDGERKLNSAVIINIGHQINHLEPPFTSVYKRLILR